MAVEIRFATQDDAIQILDIYRPIVETSPASFEIDVPTIQTRIETYTPWLICEIDQIVAGYVYASPHRSRSAYQWSVDVSVYIHTEYRRRNMGKALYTTLLELLKHQGYTNAFAGITLPNPASVRLHESIGFKQLGIYENVGYKLGHWHDVGWWQLPLSSLPQHPKQPNKTLAQDVILDAIAIGTAYLEDVSL